MYIFSCGQIVTDGRRNGEIFAIVPGSGQAESEWYYVAWYDGSEDRYMRDQISAV